jgi:lipopolysaccharide export system protein LptA
MKRSRPRVTIEHLRTLVLIGGGVLVVAIVAFLALGQWTRHFLTKDLPHRLGVDIEQSADGVNYTQTRKGKTIFKIHAAKAVKMKGNGKMDLHDVRIDLYGDDGNRSDTISGSEFDYDPNAGLATAAGEVEITLMRPGVKPAIATLKPGSPKAKPIQNPAVTPGKPGSATSASSASASSPADAAGGAMSASGAVIDNQIHVKTSGLVFNQKTGVAMTAERVDFALRQGNGTSIGAVYDSGKGQLILDHAVELHAERGVTASGAIVKDKGPVTVLASHAEFDRDDMECRLTQAKADYSGGTAAAANALLHFRDDGSVLRMDGSGGVDLRTVTGSHVTAPTGSLDFDEANHPRLGLLSGGATIESLRSEGANTRVVHGSSPTARLVFDGKGNLSMAHLEQGVAFTSDQQGRSARGLPMELHRSWKSQSADVAFVPVASSARSTGTQSKPDSSVEARTIRGFGGVVVNSETITAGAHAPSRFAADSVVAELAPGGAISSLVGTGHASVDERTAAGVHQASSADQLNVSFLPASESAKNAATGSRKDGVSEIASLVETGHVVMVQDPPPNAQPDAASGTNPAPRASIRATANRADYDGSSEMLHLTGSPRVVNGPLDMTATRIDFARSSGDAFAHGDVRATWLGKSGGGTSLLGAGSSGSASGPVHAIAAEAELHQATQEVVFKGANGAGNLPRLWQAADSVTAPVITLNRQKETLTATGNGAANPVRTVLLTNKALAPTKPNAGQDVAEKTKQDSPTTIRVRSGDLHYSESERMAVFHSGSGSQVTAETIGKDGQMTALADQAQVLLPPESRRSTPLADPAASGESGAPRPARALGSANSAIDRLTAQGHVSVDWPGRKGTGEKLVYRGEDGSYTLTGTSSAPPRITDPVRGTVTGSALIFHSGDDSVTVEGDGGKTETETRSKK